MLQQFDLMLQQFDLTDLGGREDMWREAYKSWQESWVCGCSEACTRCL